MSSTSTIERGIAIIGTTCTCGSILSARDDEELYSLIRRHTQTLHSEPARPASRPARVSWPEAGRDANLRDDVEAGVIGTA